MRLLFPWCQLQSGLRGCIRNLTKAMHMLRAKSPLQQSQKMWAINAAAEHICGNIQICIVCREPTIDQGADAVSCLHDWDAVRHPCCPLALCTLKVMQGSHFCTASLYPGRGCSQHSMVLCADGEQVAVDMLGGLSSVPENRRQEVQQQLAQLKSLAEAALR